MTTVHWATDYPDAIGNSLGYATHNNKMREALAATGVEFSEEAPIAVHVCPPHLFRPIKGKKSIVSCAWEAVEMPDMFRILRYAEAICPPAKFLLEPFAKLLPGKRIEYLPLGVDAERFSFVDREWRWRKALQRRERRPLRFLWCGAPNARKGSIHVARAWEPLAGNPGVELYMKSTTPEGELHRCGIRRIGNVIMDNRRLPIADLVKLYHDADCFVFPSQAEGYGLTMAEAMATGLPCIYTPWSAMLDLAPLELGLGYPVKFETIERNWTDEFASVNVTVANPDVTDIANQMAEVIGNYPAAVAKGRLAAERIRSTFTWSAAGATLRKIIDETSLKV
jgi:glycosyltransferase involved in cell wall biosynthesis